MFKSYQVSTHTGDITMSHTRKVKDDSMNDEQLRKYVRKLELRCKEQGDILVKVTEDVIGRLQDLENKYESLCKKCN